MTTTTLEAWHFLKADGRSSEGRRRPSRDGAIERHRGRLVPCESGLHSSPTPWDALCYAPGPLLSRVLIPEVGEHTLTHGNPIDKYVSTRRLRVQTLDISRELRLFACDEAEAALDRVAARGGTIDQRSRDAVAVARRFAVGEASEADMSAAASASWSAAASASVSASWSAAVSAAASRFNVLIMTRFAVAESVR